MAAIEVMGRAYISGNKAYNGEIIDHIFSSRDRPGVELGPRGAKLVDDQISVMEILLQTSSAELCPQLAVETKLLVREHSFFESAVQERWISLIGDVSRFES